LIDRLTKAPAETPLRFLCCCAPAYLDHDTYFEEPEL
jgi:hypothetical protein